MAMPNHPLGQRDVRPPQQRPHRYGELLAARVALVDPITVGFTFERRGLRDDATMGAEDAVGPADRLKVGAGLGPVEAGDF